MAHKKAKIIVNIQGDEPLLRGESLDRLVEALQDESIPMATLAIKVDDLSLIAGSKSKLEISVRNEGEKPVFQVWGDMDSENPLLKNVAFAFGQIGPGEERVWSAEMVPKSSEQVTERVLSFFSASGRMVVAASWIKRPKSNSSISSSSLPASILERSRISLIRLNRCFPAREILPSGSIKSLCPISSTSSTSVRPSC